VNTLKQATPKKIQKLKKKKKQKRKEKESKQIFKF